MTTLTRSGLRPGRIFAATAGLLMAVAACGTANAQYPDHDITFIVPYAAGGGSDQQARRLQPGLEEALGVGIQIVYKDGGGGAVGFLELHSSEPDGYTIANVVVPNIIVTSRGEEVGYQAGDFSYIGMTERAPGALVVSRDSELQSLADLVAFAEENPGRLTIAGTGSAGEANFAELVTALGIEATYVPVSGGVGATIPYLQGGHVDAAVFSSSHAATHNETIKALGIAGTEPSPALEGVPTLASEGYEGFEMATTWGIMAPPGTPDEVLQTLNDALRSATSDEKVKEAQIASGLTPMTQTLEEAASYVVDAEKGVERNEKLVEGLKTQ